MYQGRFTPSGETQQPQPPAVKMAAKSPKKHPPLGTTIFYTLYFLFIILFCAGALYARNQLNDWLVRYEVSQPTAKAAAVFNQLFSNPEWEELYASAGIQDSLYENAETFANYMQERTAGQNLIYTESPDQVPGEKTYDILSGAEKIAAFTLEDRNPSTKITAIPDWQVGAVKLFFNRNLRFQILAPEGCTVKVNGIALQDSHILQVTTTAVQENLPSGVTAPRMCTLAVDGLFAVPEIEILARDGSPMEVSYHADTCTFTEGSIAPALTEELKQVALEAAEYHALWMASLAKDEATLKTYFLADTDTYRSILSIAADTPTQDSTWEFTDPVVSDYIRCGEDHFSLRVEMNLSITQPGGTVRNRPYSKSMIFQKQSGGKWLCIFCGDSDLSQPVGRVRLTFMMEDIPVSSDFFHTDARQIITPVINAPEGTVFAGWVRAITDETGAQALELVFRPDITGRVTIPEDQALTPMTLYAHFEALGGN